MTNIVSLRLLTTIARVLLGLIFFVFGLNGFLHFIPQPADAMPAAVVALFGAFIQSGYFMPMIFGTQTIVGVLLLLNLFVPLALTLIAPVIVNIVALHFFLVPNGLGIALFVLALELFLAWSYRAAFIPMLRIRSTAA